MSATLYQAVAKACPGRVLTRDHPAYDGVRGLFNGMHDRRPALICLPSSVAELSAAIRAARDLGVPTAIRGGGHNVAGYGSVNDGLVIDLRLLNRVAVDPATGTATVGGGATWSDVDLATSAYGLATTGGTFDTTGVGGLTLGGGIGHLMGKYGLTCDNVLSYRMVTADGEERVVDAAGDPELDWAMRGAGHNFGAVGEFRFRLHPVSTVYGGYVAFPERVLAPAVRLFRDLMLEAPDELTCTLLLERYGPMQQAAAVVSVAYCGTDEEYRRTMEKRLRSLPVLDWRLETRGYVSMQLCLGRLPFGLRHYWSARCVEALPDRLVDRLVAGFLNGRFRAPFNDTVLIEPLHGAVRRAPATPTAVPFRDAAFNITGMAIWEPAEADGEQIAWARSIAAATEPYSRWGEGYINYGPDSGGARARATFGADAFARLQAVKRRLDPDNFFRSNYNLLADQEGR
ncbi:FAD-linked oxidase [Actinoplanes siamensis]|uniref:FAD-linked oxidase n=1 Tax=Actinoplanes siamensis TaxID=1223317 RepID=A0A919NA90_9ACTN|nr:FAD-binding oxidoreductase [Actinoplanes siamensis]GIF07100.1 FAD-linked oxidase [Actinoplanes siamensis]